jgi:hypothetical protein
MALTRMLQLQAILLLVYDLPYTLAPLVVGGGILAGARAVDAGRAAVA